MVEKIDVEKWIEEKLMNGLSLLEIPLMGLI